MNQTTTCLQNLYYPYEVYEFNNERVRPHCATGTRWISHNLADLQNMFDKYGMYMQYFENIIVDTTTKKMDKAMLKGNEDSFKRSVFLVLDVVCFDLLESAWLLSLAMQEEDTSLIKMVDVIEGTKNWYQRLMNWIIKESETAFEPFQY